MLVWRNSSSMTCIDDVGTGRPRSSRICLPPMKKRKRTEGAMRANARDPTVSSGSDMAICLRMMGILHNHSTHHLASSPSVTGHGHIFRSISIVKTQSLREGGTESEGVNLSVVLSFHPINELMQRIFCRSWGPTRRQKERKQRVEKSIYSVIHMSRSGFKV